MSALSLSEAWVNITKRRRMLMARYIKKRLDFLMRIRVKQKQVSVSVLVSVRI